MATRAKVAIGTRTGAANGSSVPLAITSLYPGDVTVSCNGVTYPPVTLTPVGTDNQANFPAAAYVGSMTITGLDVFQKYEYIVTQVGNPGTETGSTCPAPNTWDDFALYYCGCDNHQYGANGEGAWSSIRDYDQNGPLTLAAIIFHDDLGYVDSAQVHDTETGHKTTSFNYPEEPPMGTTTNNGFDPANAYVYDYVVGHMAYMGLFADTENRDTKWGRDENRSWCNQNINILPQWGDHEFFNDLGWSTGRDVHVYFANGKAAWDAIYLPLQPPCRGNGISILDQTANHWGVSYGCLNIAAFDIITNANGTSGAAPTVCHGTDQIDDVLNFVGVTAPKDFTILSMATTIRNLVAGDGLYNRGGQHSLWTHIPAEYKRIFVNKNQAIKSIMDNPYTNGTYGVTVTMHGDYHRQMALKNTAAGDDINTVDELFYSVYNGTTNGSFNFAIYGKTPGDLWSYNGSEILWNCDWVSNGMRWGATRIEVYGSRSPREMHIILFDDIGAEKWRGRWLSRSGPEAVSNSWVRATVCAGSNLG